MTNKLREIPSTRWSLDFYEQWSALLTPFSKWNWIDFTFCEIGGELSRYKGSCELEVMLLGVGFVLTYTWDDKFVTSLLRESQRWTPFFDETDRK